MQSAPLALRTGDSLVLCSDGLFDGVTDDEIAIYVGGRDAHGAAQALVDLANERGGHDNITVTVLHFGVTIGVRGHQADAGPARRTLPDVDAPADATPTSGRNAGGDLPPGAGRARTVRTVIGIAAGVLGLGLAGLAIAHYLRNRPSQATTPASPAPADAGTALAAAADARAADGAVADARAVKAADARPVDPAPVRPAKGAKPDGGSKPSKATNAASARTSPRPPSPPPALAPAAPPPQGLPKTDGPGPRP